MRKKHRIKHSNYWFMLPLIVAIMVIAAILHLAGNGFRFSDGKLKDIINQKLADLTQTPVQTNDFYLNFNWHLKTIAVGVQKMEMGGVVVDNIHFGLNIYQLLQGNWQVNGINIDGVKLDLLWQNNTLKIANPALQAFMALPQKKLHNIGNYYITNVLAGITLPQMPQKIQAQLNFLETNHNFTHLNFYGNGEYDDYKVNFAGKMDETTMNITADNFQYRGSSAILRKLVAPTLNIQCTMRDEKNCQIALADSKITAKWEGNKIAGNINIGNLNKILPSSLLNEWGVDGGQFAQNANFMAEFDPQMNLAKLQADIIDGQPLLLNDKDNFDRPVQLTFKNGQLIYKPNAPINYRGQVVVDGFVVAVSDLNMDNKQIKLQAKLDNNKNPYSIKDLPNHWPKTLDKDARQWVLNAISNANVHNADVNVTLNNINNQWELADINARVAVQNGILKYLPAFPAMQNITADIFFTSDDIKIKMANGESNGLVSNNGMLELYLYRGRPDPIFLTGQFIFNGDIAKQVQFAKDSKLPVPEFVVKQQFTGDMQTALNIKSPITNNPDVKYQLKLTAPKIQSKLPFVLNAIPDAQQFTATIENNNYDTKFQLTARRDGSILPLEIQANGRGDKLQIKLRTTANAENFMAYIPQMAEYKDAITGPITLTADVQTSNYNNYTAQFAIEATNATINPPHQLFSKPAQMPATANGKMAVDMDKNTINFETLQYKDNDNKITIADAQMANQQLTRMTAEFYTEQTGKGAVIVKNGGGAVEYSGNLERINLQNFVQKNNKSSLIGPPANMAIAVSQIGKFAFGNLILQNEVVLPNAQIFWQKRGDEYSDIDFITPDFYYKLHSLENGSTIVDSASPNFGLILKGFDFTKNMQAGAMKLTGQRNKIGEDLQGLLIIEDFKLNNAGILAKLLEISSLSGTFDALKNKGVEFKKLRVEFSKNSEAIFVRESAISGPALGFSIDGNVNLKNNLMEISGTIIPYSNTLKILDSIPLINNLLPITGKYALFGIKYKLSGPNDDPELFTYPLSVLTPGYLRKIFDWVNF